MARPNADAPSPATRRREDHPAPAPQITALESLSQLANPASVLARLGQLDWSFTDDATDYLAHDLHPYPAKFIPQIPANLIAALSLPGELVWDPFSGSGTTALESLLLGRRALATDANPVAGLICRAKTTALSPEERHALQDLHDKLTGLLSANLVSNATEMAYAAVSRHRPAAPNLTSWFHEDVIRALCYLKEEILRLPSQSVREFALVVFSSIIIRVSQQDSETRYAKRARDIDSVGVIRTFCRTLATAVSEHAPLETLLGNRRAAVQTLDLRGPDDTLDPVVPRESVDLIVTSPPYANATDYHLYHRFRLYWLGFDPTVLASTEIGSHLRHQRLRAGFDLYQSEMMGCLARMSARLRPGRYAALVLGDSVFDGTILRTAELLAANASHANFETVGTLSRALHATRRSFIPAARRARSENILLLRKKPKRMMLAFASPSYKLWPYEEQLRRLEIEATFGIRPRSKGELLFAEVDSYQVDRLHRLAFSHRVSELGQGARPKWTTWQAVLENGDAIKGRKNPKYLTHGIHPYKGKFYPQLAKALLNVAAVPRKGRVLDPFCGSGTVLLEAQLNGISAVGVDLHPLAVLISRAKTLAASENDVVLDRELKTFADSLRGGPTDLAHVDEFSEPARAEVLSWFPTSVAAKLGWILPQIRRTPNEAARTVLEALLSSLLREISQQEPADLRIRRRKQPLSDAPVIDLLSERIASFRERFRQFSAGRSWAPADFGPVVVYEGDNRSHALMKSLSSEAFDCVVTSPPYATALPYIDTDRLSLLVLFGMTSASRGHLEQKVTGSREIREAERRDLEAELVDRSNLARRLGSRTAASLLKSVFDLNSASDVGFRRRNMAALLVRYFSGMLQTMTNLATATKPGADVFIVIGDNKTVAGGRPTDICSGRILTEIARTLGWGVAPQIPITVTREALLHSQNSITTNHILHFTTATN